VVVQEIFVLLMFFTLMAALLAGFPVAFTLAGVGVIFAFIGIFFGVFDLSLFGALPSRIYGGAMTSVILTAVPLFVFMGVMLERSRVAEELLDTMAMAFGRLPGGLGVSVVVVGALMAASTGIVGATVVTMGLLSLPTMLRRGYAPSLSAGTICAAGTLGQIIPPSIVLVLLADQLSNAYAEAQRSLGNWSPDPFSVGDLFAGALIPGFILVGAYIAYVIFVALANPSAAPAIPRPDISSAALKKRIASALLPPLLLIVSVLGSILSGIATPTEAASVGAIGALLLAGLRLSSEQGRPIYGAVLGMIVMVALANVFDLRVGRKTIPLADAMAIFVSALAAVGVVWGVWVSLVRVYLAKTKQKGASVLHEVVLSTMKISTMVFVILIGASVFSLVFRGLGGDQMVKDGLAALPGGTFGAVFSVMVLMFVLGFFLDFIEITFVVVPIVAPALFLLGISPVWLGVMMAINIQTSFLTPPFGFSLFYLRGVAPKEVLTKDIYKGVMPFIAIQIAIMALIALFPELSNWLPRMIYG
jgi:tripartite ATP-independent transporter DctM subunit